MLVGASEEFRIFAAVDRRKPRVKRLSLQPGIAYCLVRFSMAHDAGENEQRVLPLLFVDAVAPLVQNPTVVGVHKGVASALKFVVHARRTLEVVTAGPSAGHDL